MKSLYINGNRDGYSPDQCDCTLTVGELIAILSEFDEERPVFLRNDNGYTYGSICEADIYPAEEIDDEEGEEE